MNANKILLSMVTVLLLSLPIRAVAQRLPKGEAKAELGRAAFGVPNKVVFRNLPHHGAPGNGPAKGGAINSLPRPQTGLKELEWKAVKAGAAKLPDPNGLSVTGRVPVVRSQASGTFTPGAGGFIAQDEDLFCSGGSTPSGILTPSDMGVAVSGTFVVQVVNDCVAVYDKSGNVFFQDSLNDLFGVPPNNFVAGQCAQCVTDPRVFYDFVANRFVIVALFENFASSQGFLELAASQSNDPTAVWNVYQIQVGATGQCPDYPTLGQNWANDGFVGGIYVGFNIFGCNPGGFSGNIVDDQVWFLPKGPIYAGQNFGFNFGFAFTVGGTLVDTIQPVNVSEWGQKPRTEFAVNSFNINFGGGQCRSGCNGLVIWSFANTLQQPGSPGPVISGTVIGTPSNYSLSANADQPGANNSIETIDTRITGTVQYMGDNLFPTLDTGNGGTSAVLGWRVQPFLDDNGGNCTGAFVNACPNITGATIVNEFCYDCGAGHGAGAYFGTIQPDPELNWTMVFNFSNQTISPGTAYTSNRTTWQTPFHDAGIFLCQNQSFYAQGRWGDYTATAPDLLNADGTPSVTPAFWFAGMFVKNNGQWSTCIGANQFSSVIDP